MTTDHRAFLEDYCERWIAAWDSHDPDQLLATFTDDIVWDDKTFWPNVIHGKEELRRYIEKIYAVMPDVRFEEKGRFFDPDQAKAIVLWRMWGSAPPGFPDKQFDFEGCDIFLGFKDGKLSHYQAAYDITDMMRQLGMLPERNGKIGGAYFMSLLKAGRQAA